MTTIQIRIDEKTKKATKKVLDNLGMDFSGAIKIYLKQIVINEGIPLKIYTKNGLTHAQEKSIVQASKEVAQGKNVSKIMKTKEALLYLKSL